MSEYKFTRMTGDENDFVDGEYGADVNKIVRTDGLYGDEIVLAWHINSPQAYANRFKWEHFNIGSNVPEIREKAQKAFNKLWSQMTDDEDGSDFDLQKILYKEAIIKIKNYPGKDGTTRAYIVHRTRTEKKKGDVPKKEKGFHPLPNLPSSPVKNTILVDDEIPF